MRARLTIIVMVVVIVLGLTACENLWESHGGRLAIFLTDRPAEGIQEVNVTITRVDVNREGGAWETLNDMSEDPLQVNLLDLRFDEELLGDDMLPPGNYTEIRLICDDSSDDLSNVVIDGEKNHLIVPSGIQTGLKIHHQFTIEEEIITQLVLDAFVNNFVIKAGSNIPVPGFEYDPSEHAGKYIMNPTAIRVFDKVISSNLRGRVVHETEGGIEEENIYVQVFDAEKDEPIAEVLALEEEKTVGGETYPVGSFQINGLLPEETYYIRVIADSYEMVEETADYELDEDGYLLVPDILEAGETVKLDFDILLVEKE